MPEPRTNAPYAAWREIARPEIAAIVDLADQAVLDLRVSTLNHDDARADLDVMESVA